MAYDRYDRDERSRWSDDRNERGWRGEDRGRHHQEQRGHHGRDQERGFFERAGDEISSWFGGSDHDERPGQDHRRDDDHRWSERGPRSERDHRDHRSSFGGGSRDHDDNSRWNRNMWGSGEQDRSQHREQGYRPMAGDYGRGSDHRSSEFFAASGVGRGQRELGGYDRGQDRGHDRDYGRSETPYGRDDYRRTSFAGSRKQDRDYDPHYSSWRDQHMSELDRDYHDFRREHQSKFESDFTGWREKRQQKRGLLGQIREHMEVVGSDDEHVGTVDKVAGDRLILTKSDPESGGSHHSLTCSMIDRVEDNRVILDCKADEAKHRWRDENRDRALFEREDQGEMGPGILERSFSGTYR